MKEGCHVNQGDTVCLVVQLSKCRVFTQRRMLLNHLPLFQPELALVTPEHQSAIEGSFGELQCMYRCRIASSTQQVRRDCKPQILTGASSA